MAVFFGEIPSGGGSSIPASKALPNGYEYRTGANGELELWRIDVDPDVLITSQTVGELEVNGSLKALVNTIYLEDAHAIKSSGEEVVFKNLESNVNYTPVWQYTSNDGSVVGKASMLVEGTTVEEVLQNGAVTPLTSVDFIDTYITTSNATVYELNAIAAEAYVGELLLEVKNLNGDVVYRNVEDVNLAINDTVIFNELFYRVRIGNTRSVGVKKSDGQYLKVLAGVDTLKPYVKFKYRAFEDKGVAYLGSNGKLDSSLLPEMNNIDYVNVANQTERLSLPLSTRFRIVTQFDTQRQWYIEENTDPSIIGNWFDAGSIAANVNSFNTRTGAVTPQSGDYTASMVGAVPEAPNDTNRRVLIGNTPTLENIVDNLTTDSATQPLSARQGKVLSDSKQDKLNGLCIHRFIQISNAANSTNTSSNSTTTTILPLLGNGSFNGAFNNPTGYGSLNTVGNYIDVSNINSNANLLFRVTMTNNEGGSVNNATLVLRLIPDINTPTVFNDVTNVPETFSTQAAFMSMVFHGGIDAVRIGIRTSSVEDVRLNGVYMVVSEPIVI